MRAGALTIEEALESPFILLGTRASIADRLTDLEERLGITEICVSDVTRGGFDDLVRRR